MDIFQQIRLSYLNRAVKLGISVFLLLCALLAFYIGYRGLFDNQIGWIEASAYLLGILLPILVIGALLIFSSGGIDALQSRTEVLLRRDLPSFLRQIPDGERAFGDPGSRCPTAPSDALAVVKIAQFAKRCYADYEVTLPDVQGKGSRRRFYIRVELNVKKANFNLYFPYESLAAICSEAEGGDDFAERCNEIVLSSFEHTRRGAAFESGDQAGRYSFNERLLERRLLGQTYYCLVGSLSLPHDFLWNPAERLFFCQDLMFMLRAFLNERGGLFTLPEAEPGTSAARVSVA